MLTLHNLAFERNQYKVFNPVNANLKKGEVLQIRGDNGSGKSTLLRLLTGLLEPHHGAILWENQSIAGQKDYYQQQLQYIGHQNGIKSYLTVFENLTLQSVLAAKPTTPAAIHLILEKINLKHAMHTQAFYLSAGQLRRLSLAKLLLYSTPLWILDEPTTALDWEGQQFLMTLLTDHLSQGGMAVVATHQSLPLTGNTLQVERTHD